MPKLVKAYDTGYTIIDNKIFKDKRLSAKDWGILLLMISLPNDWEFSIYGLSKICKDGKDSIRSSVIVLEKNGYLTRKQIRNDKGTFDGYDYYLYMDPNDNPDYASNKDQPMSVFPLSANSSSNDSTTNKQKQESKQRENTNKLINNKNDINNNNIVTNTTKHNNLSNDVSFNIDKFITSSDVAMQIARMNEASYTDEWSKSVIKYATSIFELYKEDKLKIINEFTDKEYLTVFKEVTSIVDSDPYHTSINNKVGYIRSVIDKCISNHCSNNYE